MARLGTFDADIRRRARFSRDLVGLGRFDPDLIGSGAVAPVAWSPSSSPGDPAFGAVLVASLNSDTLQASRGLVSVLPSQASVTLAGSRYFTVLPLSQTEEN